MKPTEVIQELIKELKRELIIEHNKDFLELIGLPIDKVHIKRLSAYLNRNGAIRDNKFLLAVEKKFGFDNTIWIDNNFNQKNLILKAIKRLSKGLYSESASQMLDRIIIPNFTLTHEQKRLLREFEATNRKDMLESMIDNYLNMGLLDKTMENQEFLTKLIEIAYIKGLYSIIANLLLPNLIISYRQSVKIQKIEAHTYGSLGNYKEAKYILKKLIHDNTIENINLKTSALSNHKREILSSKDIDSDNLYLLIEGYKSLFESEEIYSYYTGINLVYMVILGRLKFQDDIRFKEIDVNRIYQLSKESLKSDTTHEPYYNIMSDLEFQLLLGHNGVLQKIESFLEMEQPNPTFVERTLRQMRLFVSHTKDSKSTIVDNFKESIKILDGYIKYKQEQETL